MFRLGDLTLAEFMRHLTRYGGTILEEDGLLLFAGAHPHPNPYRNGAIRLDERLDPDEVLARAERFFHSAQTRLRPLGARARGRRPRPARRGSEPSGPRRARPAGVLPRRPAGGASGTGGDQSALGRGRANTTRLRPRSRRRLGHARDLAELASSIFFNPESVNAPNIAAYVAYLGDVPSPAR